MIDHSQDDWYIDSGMLGQQVRVQNGGLQQSWYAHGYLEAARYPEAVARDILIAFDAEWKRECARMVER